MPRALVVKAATGSSDPERCAQALTIAATAASSGVSVSLWLAAEGAWLAVPGRASAIALAGSPDLGSLLSVVLDAGKVTLCSQCAARRNLTTSDILPGIQIAGAASFVSEITAADVQALVY